VGLAQFRSFARASKKNPGRHRFCWSSTSESRSTSTLHKRSYILYTPLNRGYPSTNSISKILAGESQIHTFVKVSWLRIRWRWSSWHQLGLLATSTNLPATLLPPALSGRGGRSRHASRAVGEVQVRGLCLSTEAIERAMRSASEGIGWRRPNLKLSIIAILVQGYSRQGGGLDWEDTTRGGGQGAWFDRRGGRSRAGTRISYSTWTCRRACTRTLTWCICKYESMISSSTRTCRPGCMRTLAWCCICKYNLCRIPLEIICLIWTE
jgi:hypothetical protein